MAMRLALTVGDPAGIGPEVVLKALARTDRPSAEMIGYGRAAVLRERATRFGLRPIESLGTRVVDVPARGPVPPGVTSAAAGHAAAEAVLSAARDALAGRVDALVTAPLNKESLAAAGHRWPGHTEMLAEAAGVSDVAMLFVGGTLRVALVTIPPSLPGVPDAVNVTLGLPFVRTSVDHGTGFDIVEKGVAEAGSLLAAIRLAADLVLARR